MKCTFQFPVCNVMMYLLYCKYYFVSYSCTCPNSWRGCCLCQSGEHNKSDLYHQLILCTTSRYYLVPWIKGGSTISIYKQKKIFLARTFKSKQGRPPRESERSRTLWSTSDASRLLSFIHQKITTAPLLPNFLDPSIHEIVVRVICSRVESGLVASLDDHNETFYGFFKH